MTAGSNERASVEARPPEPVVDLEERNWLARHRRDEAEAFPVLLDAYRRPVYAYLVRAGVGEADRDDLVGVSCWLRCLPPSLGLSE